MQIALGTHAVTLRETSNRPLVWKSIEDLGTWREDGASVGWQATLAWGVVTVTVTVASASCGSLCDIVGRKTATAYNTVHFRLSLLRLSVLFDVHSALVRSVSPLIALLQWRVAFCYAQLSALKKFTRRSVRWNAYTCPAVSVVTYTCSSLRAKLSNVDSYSCDCRFRTCFRCLRLTVLESAE